MIFTFYLITWFSFSWELFFMLKRQVFLIFFSSLENRWQVLDVGCLDLIQSCVISLNLSVHRMFECSTPWYRVRNVSCTKKNFAYVLRWSTSCFSRNAVCAQCYVENIFNIPFFNNSTLSSNTSGFFFAYMCFIIF